jgi:hypothetical protein
VSSTPGRVACSSPVLVARCKRGRSCSIRISENLHGLGIICLSFPFWSFVLWCLRLISNLFVVWDYVLFETMVVITISRWLWWTLDPCPNYVMVYFIYLLPLIILLIYWFIGWVHGFIKAIVWNPVLELTYILCYSHASLYL